MSSTTSLKLSDSPVNEPLLGPGYRSFPAYGLDESSDHGDITVNEEPQQSLLESVRLIAKSDIKERFWPVAAFSLIACLGSAINGAMGGYSSATLVELSDTFESDPVHGFPDTSIYASLFGVSYCQCSIVKQSTESSLFDIP